MTLFCRPSEGSYLVKSFIALVQLVVIRKHASHFFFLHTTDQTIV